MTNKSHLLIKSQLSYIRYNLYSTLIIFVGIFWYAYISDFNPINLLSFLLFVQYSSIVVLKHGKENRNYLIKLLALSSSDVALTRIFLIGIGYTTIYFLAFLLHLIIFDHSSYFRDSYYELFMFGGIAALGMFSYLILSDAYTIFRSKSSYYWFNTFTVLFIGLAAFSLIIVINETYKSSTMLSGQIIFLIYLAVIGLAIVSYSTYQRRESYLDQT